MADDRHNRAVTLVEMLVVLGVIAVLAGMVVKLTLRVDTQSKERALNSAFALLSTSLREYYEFRDTFPPQSAVNDPNSAALHIETMMAALRSVPESRQVLDQLNQTLIQRKPGAATDVLEVKDPWGTVLD
ncbi:MAG: type II secretion system protein, partial [Solirubrobacterales bacterium]